jgi:hypothetical protein
MRYELLIPHWSLLMRLSVTGEGALQYHMEEIPGNDPIIIYISIMIVRCGPDPGTPADSVRVYSYGTDPRAFQKSEPG